ncbi:MAG: endonuclease Q family protein [Methanoregulaceae archaeon]|nr:endonuclease Q family protein [Methanoregulaceae archaeon]
MSRELFCDLHIHSCFSIASSSRMLPSCLIEGCTTKGIGVLGSGDALHAGWRDLWKDTPDDDRVLVVPTVEVEDRDRVHHLVILDSFERCEDLASLLAPHAANLAETGRPHIRIPGSEIAGMVHDLDGLIGPAHAFTPWTSLYAAFDHLSGCYGDERPDFLELGLSADSSYGAGISDLSGIPFLTNSDAHSPDPSKLGREFFGIAVAAATVRGVMESIRAGQITMNAGFFPEEGKYNRTACTRCFRQYTPTSAASVRWRCPDDRGLIKKGVSDRAAELADAPPATRPPYLHIIPLAEIIRTVIGCASPRTRGCTLLYDRFIARWNDEIRVLTKIPVRELAAVDRDVAQAIESFRSGRIRLSPGGGGRFGSFSFF